MKIKETRRINAYDLRNFCIKYNLYTSGNNADYENLLFGNNRIARKFAKQENITANDIFEIAKNIVEHSNEKHAKFYLDIENCMCYLADICITNFEIIE